jgi:hypothetical protein
MILTTHVFNPCRPLVGGLGLTNALWRNSCLPPVSILTRELEAVAGEFSQASHAALLL